MTTTTDYDRDAFVAGYIECALWTGVYAYPDESDPNDYDRESEDIAPESLAAMRAECDAFITANLADLERVTDAHASDQRGAGVINPGKAGHDFWLTRNGHGAGYWDEYYGNDAELRATFTRLTDAAHVYGETYLYAGDDDKVYAS